MSEVTDPLEATLTFTPLSVNSWSVISSDILLKLSTWGIHNDGNVSIFVVMKDPHVTRE